MKKINIPRIIWVSSIFIILIIILYLIVNYKINYEYLNKNNLYFYECDSNICVSEVKDNSKLIYSKYKCGYESCPNFLRKIDDDYVLLEKNSEYILYNFRNSKIISTNYQDYKFITPNYIIVTSNNKQGIIDINNKVIANTRYDQIGYLKDEYLQGYNLNNILVKQNDLYGIISYKDGKIVEEIKYNEEEKNILIEMLKDK